MSLWKWKLDGSKKYFKCIIKGRGLVETQVNWFENKHTRASNQEHLNFLARIEKRYTYLTKSIYIFWQNLINKTIDFDKVFLGDKNIKSIRFQRHTEGWLLNTKILKWMCLTRVTNYIFHVFIHTTHLQQITEIKSIKSSVS